MHSKRLSKGILFFALLAAIGLLLSPLAEAQNWTPLPPYNTLWPLWTPSLSPVNPATNLRTPIVTNLRPSTVLPVQPCLTWDPSWLYPFLLYNTPLGMAYYDPALGVNLWPPKYMIDPLTGGPAPITLPPGYTNLAVTGSDWLLNNVNTANLSYLATYPTFALTANPIVLPPVLTSALPGLSTALINLVTPPPTITSLLSAANLVYP